MADEVEFGFEIRTAVWQSIWHLFTRRSVVNSIPSVCPQLLLDLLLNYCIRIWTKLMPENSAASKIAYIVTLESVVACANHTLKAINLLRVTPDMITVPDGRKRMLEDLI